MLETLDDATVHRWCGGGLASLRAHQHEIDELNVYPVPDGDTGTNLVLTMISAQQALDEPPDEAGNPLGRAMRRMARGALLGARGNSGVIVSQILRGMADTFAVSVTVRGGELARALRTATEAAYAAVARPVEGTVLSVVAAAAEGAGKIASDDLVLTARAAAKAAADALARTPQQLPVLARAGVVDAGGRGLVLLLEALVDALNHRSPLVAANEPPMPTPQLSALAPAAAAAAGPAPAAAPAAAPAPAASLAAAQVPARRAGYEVQYLLDAPAIEIPGLRAALDGLGDSLVIVGTGGGDQETWNVHIHVAIDDVGSAIEFGLGAGRLHRLSISHLDVSHPDAGHPDTHPQVDGRAGAGPDGGRAEPDGRGVVVFSAGDGLAALFAAEGAVVVGRNPSTAEVLDAVGRTGAARIVLLPNDRNTQAVAAAAAREAATGGIRVSVVPTRSPVQALAALAVRDAQRPFDDDVIAMAEAAGACRYGEVCVAGREAFTVAGRCAPGDVLGLVDGEVLVVGHDLGAVGRELLDRMLGGGGELVTLVAGADAPPDLQETLRAHTTQAWPFVELQYFTGGQPYYHLLVGVE